ncbi:MAG: hypothetical protein QHC89_02620 [Bosea sp. (in: a-proteobacteria)]|nr:hypothetical protein [Bosea sp. (in: a-proteobacteria)]
MHQAQSGFFDDLSPGIAETLSKKGFAERIGVSAGRVSQMITAGLPVQPNGRIALKPALAWVEANIDPNRRRAALDQPGPGSSSRARRDAAEAITAELKAGKMAGDLILRRAALSAIEARARMERDSWLAFPSRAAAHIAAETGADARVILAQLDILVREQLDTLSKMKIERLER